jgi:hypothetical protein
MATKEETLARHSVVNGTSQPEIFNEIEGTMAPSEASERTHELPIEPVNGHSASQATADPLAPPHIILREAEHQLDLARAHVRECRSAVVEARANFARCLGAWNASGPAPMTQAELMKEYVASNQRERERKAAAGQGVFYPGVGRTAKALAGGNAKNGGGASYRRGAFTRAQAMEINAAKLRAAKLPSQR